VEVDTVDRFQGRDKECVVLSLVSHNSRAQVCALPPLFFLFLRDKECLVLSLVSHNSRT